MKAIRRASVVVAICAMVAGCQDVTLVPGADQVKVTRDLADVANCASLGDLPKPPELMTDPDAERNLQNETFSLGGNALLLTSSLRRTGAAYRCGNAGTTTGQIPAAPATTPAVPPATVAVQTSNEIVQGQVGAFNRHDLEAFLSFYADDAKIFDYPDQLLTAGKDAIREYYRKLFEPAPQLRASILHRIAFDRFVVDQEKITGRADGQVIELVSIYEIKNGRIARVTFLRP